MSSKINDSVDTNRLVSSPSLETPSPNGLGSSSVHTKETSVQHVTQLNYQTFRRLSCRDEWQRAAQVYSYVDSRDSRARYNVLDSCRGHAWFARENSTGMVSVLSNACHLRWCPVCQSATKYLVEQQTLDWLSNQTKPKFITLTLKHSSAPLTHQLKCLYDSFRKLRRAKLLTESVTGGIWFFQITFNKETEQWHPHIHLVANSNYIPQSQLSSLWLSITGSSSVVDIRVVRSQAKAADYVSRYATTPCKLLSVPFIKSIELFDSLHGKRICGTFGSARNLKLHTNSPEDKGKWQNVGSWWTVTRMVKEDPNAEAIYHSWVDGIPLPKDVSCLETDMFWDDVPVFVERLIKHSWDEPHLFPT